MNVLEKAEKALEYLKNVEGSAKSHELQAATQTLGRCLGALGNRQNCAKHYANLLHAALPVLLSLASNNSAEIRLIGDEALNRAVVGGFAFHSYKTNVLLQNQIAHTKNARWIRAALSRICLGDCWLRPGVGKIRSQAQTLFPKLTQIVKQTSDIQLILEALESNLPRILPALADYTTNEEICDLAKALLSHIESAEAAVRRGVASCVAHLVAHRELLLSYVLGKVFESLWPVSSENSTILGWFGVIKSIFQTNEISKFSENEDFGVQDYLELYHICTCYLELSKDHNIQNAVMECLTILLGHATGPYRKALLDPHPKGITLANVNCKGHRRNISSASGVSSRFIPSPLTEPKDQPELSFSGALQLGSLLKLDTPSLSVEDLTVQTPDSPASEADLPELPMSNPEQLTQHLSEKLREYEEDLSDDIVDHPMSVCGIKINIGSSSDEDVYLKYCARLLASKFLLTGNKGDLISDRSVRVSVKSSALNCLSEVIHLYPQAITMYLDKDADIKYHNISGSSETDSNQEHINDFILERNVCYQDSLSNSLSLELLNRSIDSHLSEFKKDSKSLEKSQCTIGTQDSAEQRSSSKDAPSAVLDSRTKDLVTSGITDSTNPNMTNSNFTNITSHSNMTTSNDQTGYPMTSSGDILSSSIDLDMKFDHFGESTTNLDNLKDLDQKDKTKKPLKRTDEVHSKDAPDIAEKSLKEDDKMDVDSDKEFELQHMSDIFVLFERHNDPQIRGLVRVCIGNYLSSALDVSHGDYHRWRNYSMLSKEIGDNISADKLVDIVLKGLTDDLHSTVNHSLSALTKLSTPLSNSAHWALLVNSLNALVDVEANSYWLCKTSLCKLYEKLPYDRLFILYPGYYSKSKQIMDTLYRLLADQDQRVRHSAAQTIATTIQKINPSRRHSPTSMVSEIAKENSQRFTFNHAGLSLDLVRRIYFYYDLPSQLKTSEVFQGESLKILIGDIMGKIMGASCRYYSQGLLETLQAICHKWCPWKHIDVYSDQGILSYCIDSLDDCNGPVGARTVLLDLCALIYPVEIHNIMRHKTANLDIFERDTQPPKNKWQHLDNASVASLAEKFLQVTLKMLNVLVHLIEEVNPNVHLNKGGIALPGSPVRRKSQDQAPKKPSTTTDGSDEKSLRKKTTSQAVSLKGNLTGHFFNEPFYMKLYENLRATYSNHKINLDPKSSMFYEFLSTTLNCLAIQLELSTEREYGGVTEEILYYLRVIMPLCPEKTVYCITQLLKCLFGTNVINQYADFMSIEDKKKTATKTSFFDDVMMVNALDPTDEDSRRNSIASNTSQKLSLDDKNPRMIAEKELLIKMENFSKNRTDRKWSTNKKELERYIRLFEPVVIQSLKSYTMQNDIPLQCAVLCLLSQLLTLRVNYCMLDSDQIFIGFLMKQLDLVEQHEIPNCCELVNSILIFLVQLSSSKHHTKQIIEIPKLIQLCDGLMASGAQDECIAGLEPVAVRVFSNMGGASVLGRAQQQEAQATREVLFYMLQKSLHQHKVLDLVACVLSLSQEHPESYYRWSELASDTLLNLLSQRSIEIDTPGAVSSLERLLESVYKDVLLEQSRVEMVMKILFKPPPEHTTPTYLKIRYLSIIMVLLRKVVVMIPETEMLLTINYLKAAFVSPQSIFFHVKNDVDPLNVQNVNDHCANLSPDVILVRFLFKTLTYAITEIENVDFEDGSDRDENRLLYTVCVNIIIQVKHMLHLTDNCLFPLTSKTAQTILHNEQSGLNTGLYSPEENIPLDTLNLICLRFAHRAPMLTIHWSHLLIRLNFLSHKYWQKLVGFARNVPWSGAKDTHLLRGDILQTACVLAYCEYFVENGLTEVIHLTWLLVNRVHILVSQCKEHIVQSLVSKVQQLGGASGLLLQAIAARCQNCLKDEFALNAYNILSLCHANQSGALVFLICRIIGKLEPAVAARFAKLAVERCRMLKDLTVEEITAQLSKEDVQVAVELLQRDKVYVRYSTLVKELNMLASSVFDLSPLDLSQGRTINPHHIVTTNVDRNWLVNQVKARCCQSDCKAPKIPKQKELALVLSNLSQEDLTIVMSCPEFDRKLLSTCFKVSCDVYSRDFLNTVSVIETKEIEKESIREQRQMEKLKEEMTASIDSNKLNVVNTLHVFKKSDNKESKSQFFIPITDNTVKDFGNLQITEEQTEFNLPELPNLYTQSLSTFDKSLTDVIKLFPKQNRPLSQSENFDLNAELSINRYTHRCHQVFQDKLFYREFINIQTILTGFLETLERLIGLIDEFDCDLLDKCIENIIPANLAKSIAIFSVISLQYISFLIKNKKIVESPVHADVSFRATVSSEMVTVDNVIAVTIDNVSKALTIDEIWTELNSDSNINRTQSAICCLYAVVKYLVKDTKPLTLQHYMQIQDGGPKPDIIIAGDKLITLVDYWEKHFYTTRSDFLPTCCKEPLERLIIRLARLDIVNNIALIPPIAWSSVEVSVKNGQLNKVDLPLQALQDLDVLEPFVFRVNLIGWSSKKQFEEVWVGLLTALQQSNGPHCAVRGITQLLTDAAPSVRAKGILHTPREDYHVTQPLQRLRNILVGTSAYRLFENVNLERIPLMGDGFDGYHYAQMNAEYLKLAADIIDEASYKVSQEVKRMKRTRDVDVNSCLQLLMDVAAQMLEPKAPTGLACSVALLSCIIHSSELFTQTGQWCYAAQTLIGVCGPAHAHLTQYNATGRALLHALSRCLSVLDGFEGLQELSTVHQKLVKSLSSSYAPLRQAALQGCLLQLTGKGRSKGSQQSMQYQQLIVPLTLAVKQYLAVNARISLYEQSLYWTVLFTLIELGNPELINIPVEFILNNPRHYCADLVVKGITNTIRQQILPKELKKSIIVKLLDNMRNYNESHAVQILMVHLFSADNKLLSPKLNSDVSNMDPDVLMSSMERITLLYKVLRQTKLKENKEIITSALKYFLRETLPPAATLSRVVIELLESCKESENISFSERRRWLDRASFNADIVFEVFETSITQDQLPVLSGWLFEALCHLVHGKISHTLLPYCVLALLVSASPKQCIRNIFPICLYLLKTGFHNSSSDESLGIFKEYFKQDFEIRFSDKRLLCVVALHSDFSRSQLDKLKELCDSNSCLKDLLACMKA